LERVRRFSKSVSGGNAQLITGFIQKLDRKSWFWTCPKNKENEKVLGNSCLFVLLSQNT